MVKTTWRWVLRVVSQKHRTQGANRKAAEARFAELLTAALAERAARKPTSVPAATRRRRLEEKRRRGRLKRERAGSRTGSKVD